MAGSWEEEHHGRYSEEESWETADHCDRCCCQHRYTEGDPGTRGGWGDLRDLPPVREDPGVSLRDSLLHLEVPEVWPWDLLHPGGLVASWDQDSCWPSDYLAVVASVDL